jgi:hypothetical protein
VNARQSIAITGASNEADNHPARAAATSRSAQSTRAAVTSAQLCRRGNGGAAGVSRSRARTATSDAAIETTGGNGHNTAAALGGRGGAVTPTAAAPRTRGDLDLLGNIDAQRARAIRAPRPTSSTAVQDAQGGR